MGQTRFELATKVAPIELPGAPPTSASRRVLIAEAWNTSPHLETGLEIAIRLAKAGYSVDYLHYGNQVTKVEYYNSKWKGLRSKLVGYSSSPEQRGIETLKRVSKKLDLDIAILKAKLPPFKKYSDIAQAWPDTIEELKAFKWNGFSEMGISVASSLVTLTLNSQASPSKTPETCTQLAQSFAQAYLIVSDLLSTNTYSSLVVFNGRFPCVKGAVCAAKASKIDVYYHERGSSPEHFALTDYQPHDRTSLQRDMIRYYCKAERIFAKTVADRFYNEKRFGIDRAWTSFVSGQKRGLAYNLIKEARKRSERGKVIVYFSSSDDEFVAIDDVFSSSMCFEWANQIQAVSALAEAAEATDYSLIVRVHPRQSSVASEDRDLWNNLTFLSSKKHIFIVQCDSPISSYELMDMADIVVTSGSTMGVEAIYWGKPSILLYDSIYDELTPNIPKLPSKKEIIKALSSQDQPIADGAAAYAYGYFMGTFGIPFQLFNATGLLSGCFLGVDLTIPKPTLRHRAFRALKKFFLVSSMNRNYNINL
jgi:hypothetical protein